MSATCPACGVAVVPGYVRCPKCQRPLPANKRPITVAGGTAVPGGGGLPILPIAGGAIIVLVIILAVVLGGGDDDKPKLSTDPADTTTESTTDTPEQPSGTFDPDPVPTLPSRDPVNRIDPNATARDLERALKNQRLWSRVEVVGSDVEVRSSSCRDANMIPYIDAARTAFRNAGLTRVRCLENSGAVVFVREL